MLEMGLPGKRKTERPMRGFVDLVKGDMEVVNVKVEEAGDRVGWRHMIYCGSTRREQLKGEKDIDNHSCFGLET